MNLRLVAIRCLRALAWPLQLFRAGYWMRLWLASTEQQARLIDRLRDLEAEADFNGRAAVRLKAENDRLRSQLAALAQDLELARAFSQDGYRQFNEAQAKLNALEKQQEPGAALGNAAGRVEARRASPPATAPAPELPARRQPSGWQPNW